MAMTIRAESSGDIAAIRALNLAAFDGDAEAGLVDRLRHEADPYLSLVAVVDGAIAGHIVFSPATLDADPALPALALGPMAVLPARQREGIGSALVRAGLERCRELGVKAVFVLGHPLYYPRFGFVPAADYGIECDYEVPPGVFKIGRAHV